jgi:hypothetical protein
MDEAKRKRVANLRPFKPATDVLGVAMPGEQVAQLGPRAPGRASLAERPQDLVGHRVAECVAPDVLHRRVRVFPDGKRRPQMIGVDLAAPVEQRID